MTQSYVSFSHFLSFYSYLSNLPLQLRSLVFKDSFSFSISISSEVYMSRWLGYLTSCSTIELYSPSPLVIFVWQHLCHLGFQVPIGLPESFLSGLGVPYSLPTFSFRSRSSTLFFPYYNLDICSVSWRRSI